MRTVKFDGKDSWDYYELLTLDILTPEPEMKISKIDVPGRDGELDVSEAVAGHVVYYNRQLQFRFRAIGEFICQKIRKDFAADVHGRKIFIEVEDEPHLYYGRCTLRLEVDAGYYLDFAVDVDAEPYKRDTEPRKFKGKITRVGELTFANLGDEYVTPTITTSSNMKITLNGSEGTYPEGSHIAHFSVPKGIYTLQVEGTGNVELEFWEGYFV